MKIEYILEKGSGKLNEDEILLEDTLFGVFDGATSLDRKATFENGKTGGFLASSIARSVFVKNHYPLIALAGDANQAIHHRMLGLGVDLTKKENRWSTSAAVIRIKDGHLEWVQTGDSYIILIFQDNSHKVLIQQDDHDYETLCLWKAGKNGVGNCKKNLADQIRKKRCEMNITYGVLNGEDRAAEFLNHGRESLDQVREILLFTDGLSIPTATPEKKRDFAPLVDFYLTLGLQGLKNRIRQMEALDPDCTLYPRFKCHDDIAAIAVSELSEIPGVPGTEPLVRETVL